MTYQVGEVIPISIFRTNNQGAGQSGQNQRAKVFDLNTGNEIASQLTLAATNVTGLYTNLWTSGITTRKTLLVVIYEGTGTSGSILDAYRMRVVDDVQQVKDTVDLGDGRAI